MSDSQNNNSAEILSLAEASKITGYHQDYLGQLCRAGKLKGSKIGRNWTTTRQALGEFQELALEHPEQLSGGNNVPVHVIRAADFTKPEDHRVETGSDIAAIDGLPIALRAVRKTHNNLEAVKAKALQMRSDHEQKVGHAALEQKVTELSQQVENLQQQSPDESQPSVVPVVVPLKNKFISNFDAGSEQSLTAANGEPALVPGADKLKQLYQSFTGTPSNNRALTAGAVAAFILVIGALTFGHFGGVKKFFGEPSNQSIAYTPPGSEAGQNNGSSPISGQVLDSSVIVHTEGQKINPVTEAYVDRLIMHNIEHVIAQGWLQGERGPAGARGPRGPAGSGGGSGTMAIGDPITSATEGSVLFAGSGGVLAQDNSNFFWDDSTNRLGLGDVSPVAALTIGAGDLFQVNSAGAIAAATGITSSGTITFSGLGGGGTQCLQTNNAGVISGTGSACGSGGSGDSILVNGAAATDANFVDTAASGTVAAVTWTLNTVPATDEISVVVGTASATEAGIVTTGTQSFTGAKTFITSVTTPNVFGGAAANDDITIQGTSDATTTTSFVILQPTGGNVGIGTAAPASLFTVAGGATGQVSISSDLTAAARTTDLVSITQANDATNDQTAGSLLSVVNNDAASTGGTFAVATLTQNSTAANVKTLNITGQSTANAISLTRSFSTGIGIDTSASYNSLSTGALINWTTAASSTTATDFTTGIINIAPTFTYQGAGAQTRNDSGKWLNLARQVTTNNAAKVYNFTGQMVNFTSNCTQTAGTCTDSSNILNIAQSYAASTGAVLVLQGAGTGNLATFDATNTGANGVSIDVQSTSTSQYGLNITSNNGATNVLSARADGNVGIGTTAPVDPLSIGTAINASATRALFNLSNTALVGGSANGTYIGANPAAFTGNFIDFQVGGASQFSVSSAGVITSASLAGGGTQCLQTNNTGVVSGTGSACGSGGSTTLQTAYDTDANSASADIIMTAADGDIIFHTIAGTSFQVVADAVPNEDMVVISNAGQPAVVTGVDGLSIAFVTGDGANATNSAINLAVTPGGTAVGDVTNGINLANVTTTTGTENAINIGTGWDSAVLINTGVATATDRYGVQVSTGNIVTSGNQAAFFANLINAGTAGTTYGLFVAPVNTTFSGTTMLGVNIQGLTTSGGADTALNIGANWDAGFTITSGNNSIDTAVGTDNGLLVDIQSASSAQYALNVTSSNGGTTLLYARADGNVGIRTSSPTSPLYVVGDPNTADSVVIETTTDQVFGGGAFNTLDLYNTDATDDNFTSLTFSTQDLTAAKVIGAAIVTDYTSHVAGAVSADLSLYTADNSGLTKALVIKNTGNVGIGSADPVDPLSISTAVTASATRALFNLSNTALVGGSANGTYIGANPATFTGNFIDFQVGGASRFSISSAGAITSASLAGGGVQCLQTSNTGLVSGTGSACGAGGATTLQQAYDADANSASADIVMTASDGSIIFHTIAGATDTQFQIVANNAPELDIVNITNAGQPAVVTGVDGLSIAFVTGDGANATNSAINLAVTPGGTAVGDVTNGINLANVTTTTGTENAINIGTGWDSAVLINTGVATATDRYGVQVSTGNIVTSGNQAAFFANLINAGTAGTTYGLFVAPVNTTFSGTTMLGVNIQGLTTSGGADTALNIGANWDAGFTITSGNNSIDTAVGTDNGLSVDVQSSSTSQYVLSATSNNGAIQGLYVRADGHVGIGTAAPDSALHVVGSTTASGAGAIAGIHGDYTLTNSTTSGSQFGNRFLNTVNGTVAGSEIGTFIRMTDNTSLANTVRGVEIQAFSGTNLAGINTGLASFAYTFGVHAVTTAQADTGAAPAAVFAYLQNATGQEAVGNAVRAYSDKATSAELVSIFQEVSAYTGTALAIDLGNGGGSFASGNFIDARTAGTSKFKVNSAGVITAGLSATASTNAVCSSLANATGPTAGVAYEFRDCNAAPAADYAEDYPVEQGVDYTDVVTVGTQLVNTYDETNGNIDWTKVKGKITRLVKSSNAYQQNIIGVVSNNHGDFTSAGHNIKPADNPKPVALNGRVPVKVTNENGNIKAGDYLTTSAMFPGYAMKAVRSGQVIGQALNGYTSNTTNDSGTVMVFIKIGYQQIGNTIVLDAPDTDLSNVQGSAAGSNLASSNGASTFVIRQESSEAASSSSEENQSVADILQLQSGDANRFMVASNGQLVLNAAASEDQTDLLAVKQNDSSVFTINARGDIQTYGVLVIRDDNIAGSLVTSEEGLAEITFAYDLGTGKPSVQLTPEAGYPVFAQVIEWRQDSYNNYTGFVMKTFGLGGQPTQSIVNYLVIGKPEGYETFALDTLQVEIPTPVPQIIVEDREDSEDEEVITDVPPTEGPTDPAPPEEEPTITEELPTEEPQVDISSSGVGNSVSNFIIP